MLFSCFFLFVFPFLSSFSSSVPFITIFLVKFEIVCCLYGHCRVVQTICALVRTLPPNSSGAALMSMCLKILGKMLKWYPCFCSVVLMH